MGYEGKSLGWCVNLKRWVSQEILLYRLFAKWSQALTKQLTEKNLQYGQRIHVGMDEMYGIDQKY